MNDKYVDLLQQEERIITQTQLADATNELQAASEVLTPEQLEEINRRRGDRASSVTATVSNRVQDRLMGSLLKYIASAPPMRLSDFTEFNDAAQDNLRQACDRLQERLDLPVTVEFDVRNEWREWDAVVRVGDSDPIYVDYKRIATDDAMAALVTALPAGSHALVIYGNEPTFGQKVGAEMRRIQLVPNSIFELTEALLAALRDSR